MLPNVPRTAAGHRVYTQEHFAYFVCIREMLAAFSITEISNILKEIQAKKIYSALWMANHAQAELHQEKIVFEKMALHLLYKAGRPLATKQEVLTVNDISRETSIPVTTIRYWDKVGLLSAQRCVNNNYRVFTAEHVRQALVIYAFKLTFSANGQRHYIEHIKENLKGFDYQNTSKIKEMTKGIEAYLNQANKDQIKGISALYRLCVQTEANCFDQ